MFKMIFESISGVEVFPVAALIIFFSFFVGLIIWLIRADKKWLRHMEKLPLDYKAGDNGNA